MSSKALAGLLLASGAAVLSGCTKTTLVQSKDAFKQAQAAPEPSGPAVAVLPVVEARERKLEPDPFADPVFLGKRFWNLIALGPVPILPIAIEYMAYKSDVPRARLADAALAAVLKRKGIPAAEGRGASGQFVLEARLIDVEAIGKSGFVTFLSASGTTPKGMSSKVTLDCRVSRGGAAPLWQGRVTGDSFEKDAWEGQAAFAKAFLAAAEACVEKSGLVALRTDSLAKAFGEHMSKGRYFEAYGSALTLEDALAAARGMARAASDRPVPEEARALMAKGKASVALAKDLSDYKRAAASMEQAVMLAPWWASGHYNAALAQEGAGDWQGGARHLKLYLALRPDADDAEAVRMKIAELELHQERGDQPVGQEKAEEE